MGRVATVPAVTLDAAQRRRLRRVRAKLEQALAERDTEVAAAAEAGGTLREIGEEVGLSFSGVKFVVDRARDAKKPPLP